jgi:WD40 repeat protein
MEARRQDRARVQFFDRGTARLRPTFEDFACFAPVAFALGNGRCAVREGENSVRILSLRGGEAARSLRTASDARVVALSADGAKLVTAGDGPAQAWDAGTGQPLRNLDWAPKDIDGLAFDPSGSQLAVSTGSSVTVHDWVTGAERIALKKQGRSHHLSFAGNFLNAVTENAVLRWDWTTGEVVFHRPLPDYVQSGQVAMHPAGRRVALGVLPRKVRLSDLTMEEDVLEEVLSLDGLEGRVTALAFGPDGSALIAGYDTGMARLWRAPPDAAPK